MTTTWHADRATLVAFVDGTLDDVHATSLEAHLLTCSTCRDGVAEATPPAAVDRAWAGVVDALDAPRPAAVERGLLAIGVRSHVARLLALTPSLRASWLLAEALAVGVAVAVANAADGRSAETALMLFLVVAALLPLAGIAVAFGPGVDPTHDVATAAPMPGDRLLLLRSAAVVAVSVAITGVAAVALPGVDLLAAAWLLPALGCTLATLAVGTWLRPLAAAGAVALGWVALAAGAAVATGDRFAAFRPGAQVACLAALAVCAAILARRHAVFEEGIAT